MRDASRPGSSEVAADPAAPPVPKIPPSTRGSKSASLAGRLCESANKSADGLAQVFPSQELTAKVVLPVVVAVLSYFFAATLLLYQLGGDPEARDIVGACWDDRIHSMLAAVAGVQAVMQLLSYATCNTRGRFKLSLLPVLIATILCLHSLIHLQGWAPVFMGGNGRVFRPGRYISWSCTTSLLILLQWLTGDNPLSMLFKALAADWIMLVTGAGASLSNDRVTFLSLGFVSCAAEAVVLMFMHQSFMSSISKCVHLPDTTSSLYSVYAMTMVSWCSFPAVWAVAEANLVSHDTEELLWCICDFGAKMFQAAALYQGVLCTAEDRTSCALQQMRDNVLHDNMHMKEKERMGVLHIANVSHELRTPLNGIIGLSDALISDPESREDDEDLVHCLQVIRDSGARLNMLVNTLLDNAALSNQKLKLKFEPVKLSQCLAEIKPLVTPLLALTAKLEIDVPDDLPTVRGNYERLVQVFFNLLGNSLKFCRKGTISVTAKPKKRWMYVFVHDTGVGIGKERLNDIFTPFEQDDSKIVKNSYGSTGIGLSLVKALVESHEGTISVESELNQWTTITIKLPLMKCLPGSDTAPNLSDRQSADSAEDKTEASGAEALPDEDQPVPVSPEPKSFKTVSDASPIPQAHRKYEALGRGDSEARVPPHSNRIEVLSVDDDATNQFVIGNMLSKNQNYAVIKALSGENALDFLAWRFSEYGCSGSPKIILMDLMMPGIDGMETTRRIREQGHLKQVPVLMVSAKAMEETMAEAFKVGCQDFVAKPVKRLDLLSRLERELSRCKTVAEGDTQNGTKDPSRTGGPDAIDCLEGLGECRPKDLERLLATINMSHYLDALLKEGVNIATLAQLSEGDLEALGVSSMWHRKRLKAAAQILGLLQAGLAQPASLYSGGTGHIHPISHHHQSSQGLST